MAILWSNNASTTIAGSITAASTTVSLAAGTGVEFPNPTGGNFYVATFYDQATKTVYEIVHVTAMAGDVATITRAQEGTTARAWNAGDIFANLVTAGTLQNFVQAGTGPADTSVVYVGTDTSATPSLIVAVTNPVPPNLATGMLFNIKMANTNLGAVTAQLNGLAAVPVVRTNGSPMVGANLTAGEEAILVYNGTHFTSTVPPVPQAPPQTVFYVRPDGNDNNSGFANDAADAFQTIQGAINAIQSRYISQGTITVRVADGLYTSGMADSTGYIASWDIVGNTANPGNCVINCTSTNAGTYVPGSGAGRPVYCGGTANMTVEGFAFQGYYGVGANAGGVLVLRNNNYTAPTSGEPCILCSAGAYLALFGVNAYTGTASCNSLLSGGNGATLVLGGHDFYNTTTFVMNIQGTPSFGGATAVAQGGATIVVYNEAVSFTGGIPNAPQYNCSTGGGIGFSTATVTIPGSSPGVVTPPGWASI